MAREVYGRSGPGADDDEVDLALAHGADLRMGEHRVGHHTLVDGTQRFGVHHVVEHDLGFPVREVLELQRVADVAEGPHTGCGGAHEPVGDDVAGVVEQPEHRGAPAEHVEREDHAEYGRRTFEPTLERQGVDELVVLQMKQVEFVDRDRLARWGEQRANVVLRLNFLNAGRFRFLFATAFDVVERERGDRADHLERARARYHVASDRLNLARASFRQCDEVCRALQGKVNQVDVPRLGKLLAALEQARGLDAKQTLQQAMRIDRLTADMDLHCTTSMEHKAAAIVVDDVLDSVLCVASTAPPVSVVPLNGELPAPVDARRYSITRPLPGPPQPPPPPAPSAPPTYCPPSIHSSQLLLASVEALGSKRHGPEHTHSMTL